MRSRQTPPTGISRSTASALPTHTAHRNATLMLSMPLLLAAVFAGVAALKLINPA